MTDTDNLLTDEQDEVVMMNPAREGADFDDEGSGATSGYGDLTEDDLTDDVEDEEMLPADSDNDLRGDDVDDDDV